MNFKGGLIGEAILIEREALEILSGRLIFAYLSLVLFNFEWGLMEREHKIFTLKKGAYRRGLFERGLKREFTVSI